MKLASSTIALATALTSGLGLFAVSAPSQACNYEPIMGSMCAMALSPQRFQNVSGMYVLALGQTIPIMQNQALFALLGTTFGGDGQTNFRLPDLRGRVIVGYDPATFNYGTTGGAASIRLTVAQLPPHNVTFANASVNISGLTATTALSGLSATANLAGVRITGPATGLTINASTAGGSASPNGMYLGRPASATASFYTNVAPSASLGPGSVGGNLSVTVDPGVTAPVTVYGTAATTIGGSASVNGSSNLVGNGTEIPIMPPYLALPYYIAVQGIFPSTD